MDETTDISNLGQLLVYVTYAREGSIHEELLFCCSLGECTRGKDMSVQTVIGENILFVSKVKIDCNEHIVMITMYSMKTVLIFF